VIYEDNIYTNPKNPVNIGSDSEQSNNVSRGEQRGGGVIIGGNILLVYFMFQSIRFILKQ
jgi:hypothetical protein